MKIEGKDEASGGFPRGETVREGVQEYVVSLGKKFF